MRDKIYKFIRISGDGGQAWEQVTGFIVADSRDKVLYREQAAEGAKVGDYARLELRDGKQYAVLTTKREETL